MNKLLHIIATPRQELSRTLKISEAFLEGLEEKYPDCIISSINLTTAVLPKMDLSKTSGKYTLWQGQELINEEKDEWKEIITQIERFRSADAYLISTPMWNFGIPYYLKHYIDLIVQPHYTFRSSDRGFQGLLYNKKMLVVTSRGLDYSEKSQWKDMDFQEPYLRCIFDFIGIKDIRFIHAQSMDALGPKIQREHLEAAREEARRVGREF